MTDLVTLDPDPCPCGRTLVRVRAIHGRSDDVSRSPGGKLKLVIADPTTRPAHANAR